ncbi:MAG: cation-translocating P-type ATPase [Chloroflexota bacterium]|nr:cation-translocating P-type ATPase [Chloroflexota bacterium]
METKTFAVAGLTCTDCARRLEAAVGQVDGVSDCHADAATGTLTVSLVTPGVSTEPIAKAARATGHTLITGRRPSQEGASQGWIGFIRFVFSKRETALTAIAGLLTLLGLALTVSGAPIWSSTSLFVIAIVVGGIGVAHDAFQELWLSRSLGINTLMVIAVTGAAFIGEWAEAAVVVVLFSLGEALEGYATEQARGALDSLLDLAPPMALKLLPSGETQETAVEQLAVGDRVLVRPGDRVSADGFVHAGQSAVDQAPITGESIPVEKGPGDQVFAGTINTTGALEIEVTHLAVDNTLSRMVALVQEAKSRQAPVQRFIDRFARVYTPAVTVMAVLVATIPPLFLGQPFWGESGWLMRALQMLVIACPCALVISTPVSLVSAMTNGASRGVLIKGGRYLETLSRVNAFAFDKTGTLTEGRPVTTDVVDVCTCGECADDCGLQYAAALELQSSHPLAQAILAEAQARQVAVPPAQNVAILSGRGMEGAVNGAQVTVASHAHFDEHISHPEFVCRLADELAGEGKTVILVRHDDEVCAMFGVADTPRSSSRQAVADLKARGLYTVMLTGDSPSVAQAIGNQVGVDEVRAGLLPEEKVTAVAALTKEYQAVAMVGDGVNDAPALAQADVGIAMGGAGSAQAMETADVVLMGDDLSQLGFIVWLSRKTKRIVTANILLALGVKAVVFALAAAGLAALWLAIVADVGASVTVIMNGMRLRRMDEPLHQRHAALSAAAPAGFPR